MLSNINGVCHPVQAIYELEAPGRAGALARGGRESQGKGTSNLPSDVDLQSGHRTGAGPESIVKNRACQSGSN